MAELSEASRLLPPSHPSLACGVPATQAGALYALAIAGGITMAPKEGRAISFGRNRPEVHVCVGENDRAVSRRHGIAECRSGKWWVYNTGRIPIRLPGSRWLFADEEPVPLPEGYSPLFIRGSTGREHLLELHVAGWDEQGPTSRHGDVTTPPRVWRLDQTERLALTVLGQRYLLHEARPLPLSWQQAAIELDELRPGLGWTAKRVEHTVSAVRSRLSRAGVWGLTREEVGEPVGNTLNDNLLRELLLSTTLVPPDLALLDW